MNALNSEFRTDCSYVLNIVVNSYSIFKNNNSKVDSFNSIGLASIDSGRCTSKHPVACYRSVSIARFIGYQVTPDYLSAHSTYRPLLPAS